MAYGTVNVGQAQTDDSKYITTEQVGTPGGLATLDAVNVTGVWNASLGRIEF